MKEIKKEIKQEPATEVVVNNQPSEKEMVDILSQTVIQQDVKLKEQAKAIEELTAAKEDLCVECKVLKEELDIARKEIEKYHSTQACECKCDDTEGLNMPWEKKRKLMYEAVNNEISYYKRCVNELKHELIECPHRKPILKAEIKDAEAKIKKLQAIKKAVVK